MLIFKFLRKKKSRLDKLFCLPEKCIYFISYRNEHPVYMYKLNYSYLNLHCMNGQHAEVQLEIPEIIVIILIWMLCLLVRREKYLSKIEGTKIYVYVINNKNPTYSFIN